MINFSFNVEKFVKMRHYLSNLWANISGKKWIVYQAKKIGILSLFILIWFKIDQIVCDRPNIVVTYHWHWVQMAKKGKYFFIKLLSKKCYLILYIETFTFMRWSWSRAWDQICQIGSLGLT